VRVSTSDSAGGSFRVTSTDISEGEPLPSAQRSGIFDAGGTDTSPQLSWSGAPPETQSFGLTAYDPDAPTGSGFWHWVVADLPADCTSLPTNAGDEGGKDLPASAYQLRNDAGGHRFIGAAPPAGHGRHRYIFTVHALDVPTIGVGPDAPPALLGFMMWSHTLATASLTAWSETPA
jgi:Raf kinase inhibitor-like YbhB/YbcL family protein